MQATLAERPLAANTFVPVQSRCLSITPAGLGFTSTIPDDPEPTFTTSGGNQPCAKTDAYTNYHGSCAASVHIDIDTCAASYTATGATGNTNVYGRPWR